MRLQQCLPFTVLKHDIIYFAISIHSHVATVLTVYGIETAPSRGNIDASGSMLQQCLPFAVLKPTLFVIWSVYTTSLQQCLPLAVLKLSPTSELSFFPRCNSAYRLRY